MTIYTQEFQSTKSMAYVYCGHNLTTGESYIGYHMQNVKKNIPSSSDLGVVYFTSSKYIKPIFHEFEWTIVAEFFDANSAYDFEQLLIFESWKLPGSLNKHCTHGKVRFCTSGAATGNNAKGVAKTGNRAKGVPAKGKKAKGIPQGPASGRHAKGIPQGPATGNNAKGMPNTGKAAKGELKTGNRAKGMPNTGNKAKGVPATGLYANGMPRTKHKCHHCGILTDAGSLTRYHGDKCKYLFPF